MKFETNGGWKVDYEKLVEKSKSDLNGRKVDPSEEEKKMSSF